MTKREVGMLACRILAIYAWLQALAGLPYFLGLAGPFIEERPWSNDEVFSQIIFAAHPILYFVAGAFLWKWSGLVAAWMVSYDIQDHQNEPETERQRIRATELHAIAFSVLGLYILFDLIPAATFYATNFIFARPVAGQNESFQSWLFSAGIEIGLRLFVGSYLLFGARGAVHLLRKARGFGMEEAQ